MISAISWVPKGASKYVPEVAEPPSKEAIQEMIALNPSGDRDEDMDVDMNKEEKVLKGLATAEALNKQGKSSTAGIMDVSEAMRVLDMDHYDDDDENGIELFSSGLGDLYYPSNEMDPYLKKEENEEDEEDELDDLTIKPTDGVILCARNDNELNILEVCIFEESDDGDPNMYPHHEIILPAFPLSLAWLDFNPQGGEKGNFVAVGMMDPVIEIWDLNLIDEVQPVLALGGMSKMKRGKGKKIKYKEGSHRGAVLGLAWNKEFRNAIASASEDHTVKIWDVAHEKCLVTLQHHNNKVQAVAWNRHSPQLLLTGSFDKSVALTDMKSSNESARWQVECDPESLEWDPHNEHAFIVSLENGRVKCFDKRAASKSVFTLDAHDKAVTCVSFCPSAPNFLATGSMDKMVKLWDISNNQPSCVAAQNLKAGYIFSVSFSEDNPFLLAVGGSKGELQVWDTLSEQGVVNKFGKYSNSKPKPNPEP